MKKLILQEKKYDPVYLNELTDKSIIGFLNSCGDKFFMSSSKEYWVGIGANNFTTDSKIRCNSFEELIDFIKTKQDVFIFNTPLELFKWLAS